MSNNQVIYRIYPDFRGVPKNEQHNRPLGLVYASTMEEAVQRAIAGQWKKQYNDLEGYTGEYRAAN